MSVIVSLKVGKEGCEVETPVMWVFGGMSLVQGRGQGWRWELGVESSTWRGQSDATAPFKILEYLSFARVS